MKQFYSFADGVKIGDHWINEQLEKLKERVLTGTEHSNSSTGDTYISVHVYSGFIGFYVATSDGYCSINFYSLDELREWTPNFRRAKPVTAALKAKYPDA